MSKVLANRLKKILPDIISKNQSAFMLIHLIPDNIIAAYEALHSMKTRQRGKSGSMAIKLDISKAYEKLEWSFLKAIMKKLDFNEKWISRVMTCVTIVSYAVLVNGQLDLTFKPTRGLCQGDPISPISISFVRKG